ncbi:MAG: hypothetical protein KDB21_09260 [Acidimicrobiales bacterium]|nr:hypothetical protein [Acidimicrobiales bacterium]
MDGDSWAVDVVEALAIPATVIIAVLVLRKPLTEFIAGIGGRISKLSVAGFSVELSEATELRPAWELDMNGNRVDVRQLSPADVFDSYADSLLRQLAEPGALDYVVVALGLGRSWLTTRLFLFANLLARMRGLQAVVFVHGTATGDRTFLGVAPASIVRWRLAQLYPELEVQWAQASSQTFGPLFDGPQQPLIVSNTGALEQWQAGNLARMFLDGLQRHNAVAPDGEQWVEVRSGADLQQPNDPVWERAAWIDVGDVLRLLSADLDRQHIVERDSDDIDRAEQVARVTACTGDFVAVLRGDGFDRLIDRRHVVEQVARLAVQRAAA